MLHKISFLKHVLFIAGVIFSSSLAHAATFTVNSVADSADAIPGDGVCATADNQCTLRAAIMEANAISGLDNIEFNIPGACPQTIMPNPALPNITSPININGYTQPGSVVATASLPATVCIEISGQMVPAPFGANGLTLTAGGSGSRVRGLVINRFRRSSAGTGPGGNAIIITAGSGSQWIAGNYLNIDQSGTSTFLTSGFSDVSHGIFDAGSGGNIIGHDPLGLNSSNPAADRNIISGAGIVVPPPPALPLVRFGISISATSVGNKIRANYIGTDNTGTLDLGNSGDGIRLVSSNNTVEDNIISGNEATGVFAMGIVGSVGGNNVIRGNYIGTDKTGTSAIRNTSQALRLDSPNNTVEDNLISGNQVVGILSTVGGNNSIEDNKIGTDVTGKLPLGNGNGGVWLLTSNNTVAGNVIAFNNTVGVLVASFPTGVPGLSNAILGNSIFGNGGLGIDLVSGPCVIACPGLGTPQLNDLLDADVGAANNLQNFPVLDGERSFLNPALVQVWGSLDSKPSQNYLIQVFSNVLADLSGHGEGQVLIGERTVTTDAYGHVDFHFPTKLNVPVGSIITATATDLLTNDTSEFSAWVNVDAKGSPTAYEHAAGAAGGDGLNGMSWGLEDELLMPEEAPAEE